MFLKYLLSVFFMITQAKAQELSELEMRYPELPENSPLTKFIGTVAGSCTGFLGSPKHVLTAAHCVYLNEKEHIFLAKRPQEFVLNFRRGNYTARSPISKMWIGSQFPNEGKERLRDWAILELKEPLDFDSSAISLKSEEFIPGLETSETLSLTAYADTFQDGKIPFYAKDCGVLETINGDSNFIDCFAESSSSGAPLFIVEDGLIAIKAILVGRTNQENRAEAKLIVTQIKDILPTLTLLKQNGSLTDDEKNYLPAYEYPNKEINRLSPAPMPELIPTPAPEPITAPTPIIAPVPDTVLPQVQVQIASQEASFILFTKRRDIASYSYKLLSELNRFQNVTNAELAKILSTMEAQAMNIIAAIKSMDQIRQPARELANTIFISERKIYHLRLALESLDLRDQRIQNISTAQKFLAGSVRINVVIR